MKKYRILENTEAGKKFRPANWVSAFYDSGNVVTVEASSAKNAVEECRREFGGRFKTASLKAEQL